MADYYQDGEVNKTPEPTTVQDGMKEGDGEKTESQTALLPSSICPGMNVGDVIELKIVRTHDKEYEVSYEPEDKGEAETPPEPAEMGARGDAQMSDYS
jgi:hypothetical protein